MKPVREARVIISVGRFGGRRPITRRPRHIIGGNRGPTNEDSLRARLVPWGLDPLKRKGLAEVGRHAPSNMQTPGQGRTDH